MPHWRHAILKYLNIYNWISDYVASFFQIQQAEVLKNELESIKKEGVGLSGHDFKFCSDLPRRASEIQFSLALLQLSLALEKLYVL